MARMSPLLLLLFLCRLATAFDVTHILSLFPEFSTFNILLIQTQLAADINGQESVTILAVPNGAFPPIAGLPDDILKDLLSLHVVLGYLDEPSLRHRSTHTSILTTLFQASGRATGFNGFLNATDMNGQVAFGSAAPGSVLSSNFVKVAVTLPDNVSVMQITGVILHPGISFPEPPNSATAAPSPAVLPPTISPSNPSSEAPSLPPAAEPTSRSGPAPSVLPWFMPPPEAVPSEPPMAPPTAAPSMAPPTEPPAEPSIVLPPAASPSNGMAPSVAPPSEPPAEPSIVLPPAASPSNGMAPSVAPPTEPPAEPSIVLPPAASPTSNISPSSAPEASPSIAVPPAESPSNTMAPSPSTWPWDVLPSTSDAPMTPPAASPASNSGPSQAPAFSPPAPATGSSPPIGLPPSYIANGPGSGAGGEEGAASQGVARRSTAIAAGAALLVCML